MTENTDDLKSCCARLYESDIVRTLLGDSFHPGGLKLTARLGEIVGLRPGARLLDVASGKGASALHLASLFACDVIGLDYGWENVSHASEAAAKRGLSGRVRFQHGDSESLPFKDASFDAIICECAFCTFPDKSRAAAEFARVLKLGGRVGLSDITRTHVLPEDLNGLLAWIACIADAQEPQAYADLLAGAGLDVDVIEPHNDALTMMVHQIRIKLLGLEVAAGLKKLALPGIDLAAAKQLTVSVLSAIENRELGYAIVSGVRPA